MKVKIACIFQMKWFAKFCTSILLISYYSDVPFADGVLIHKCCGFNKTSFNNEKSLVSSGIGWSDDYTLSINSNHFVQDDSSVNSSRVYYPVDVNDCHESEELLTNIVSVSPNQLDRGFYKNGFFRNGNEYYSHNQYCVEKVDDKVTVKIQPKVNCDEISCLKKCCGPTEVYDLSTYGKSRLRCVPSVDRPWDPVVYSKGKDGWTKGFASASSSIQFSSDHPKNWCTESKVLWTMRTIGKDRKALFRILDDGSVLKRDGVEWKEMRTGKICLDGAINFPNNLDSGSLNQNSFSGDEFDTIMIECGPTLAQEDDSLPSVLYGVGLTISSVFLLATLIIYGLLWEKQNIHGWTLLGCVASMFIFYVSLITTYFYLYHYPDPDYTSEAEVLSSFCGAIAVISHFFYICTVCWLTVISFDIFSKFRILKLTRTRSKNRLKFLIYLMFTIVIPLSIVCPGLLLDIIYGDDLEVSIILPRYGWTKCFLDLRNAALPYLFCPIGFLLVLNCILYIATIFYMHKLQESTKFASAGANNNHIHKQRAKIRLYSKLFLLMGISWIFEIVSFLAFGSNSNILVIVGDMINILQPIAVFIIFVCKRDILKSLCQKYSSLTKIFSSFEVEEFTPSTSSNGVSSRRFTKFWNPVTNTTWFRSRINSTMTDTSNVSNQSIKSALNAIEEIPLPTAASSVISPLNKDTSFKEV